jgi:hypothetical protein
MKLPSTAGGNQKETIGENINELFQRLRFMDRKFSPAMEEQMNGF